MVGCRVLSHTFQSQKHLLHFGLHIAVPYNVKMQFRSIDLPSFSTVNYSQCPATSAALCNAIRFSHVERYRPSETNKKNSVNQETLIQDKNNTSFGLDVRNCCVVHAVYTYFSVFFTSVCSLRHCQTNTPKRTFLTL